ncbi:tRNA (guanosine(46)-N7)-methyltransferase TrmB [Feifania hominis]|uniref:tRNA (guanine-N(7)-)-methyltransferase n=1 Tax=Feifania hominis TaxID=2763660 RepID=A0A926DAF4_9FIRM|nr:tRNA (guanosine(46)-N7)-methyltransferase TrmB [Feifania hominis]MBC8535375.1 tRNA (guanosine(46)-N7)-methyltransferase TrmB [Feifania hominis]
MRPRKKKNLAARLERVADYRMENPQEYRGRWQQAFERPSGQKIMVEIGCGKGQFICEMASRHPEINFVAIEKVPDVIVMANEKIAALELKNVKLILGDAAMLEEIFEQNECQRIYINFCDPWPKARHAKRRLTSKGFLASYRRVLEPGGEIHFKTDNRPLFDFSVESFQNEGYQLKNVCYDLHNSDFAENIVTEYEKTFSEKGFAINRLEAVNPKTLEQDEAAE